MPAAMMPYITDQAYRPLGFLVPMKANMRPDARMELGMKTLMGPTLSAM